MFFALGSIAARNRWFVIGVWLALFIASAPLIPRLPGALKVGGFSNPSIESAQARAVLEETIPSFAPSALVVIFQSSELSAYDPRFIEQAGLSVSRLGELADVSGIISFVENPAQVSADGHTAYTLVQLSLTPEESQRLMPEFRERLVETSLTTTLAGAPAFFEDVERLSEQDLQRAELIAIPFALIALVLVFGSIVGAGIPLLVGGLSVATVLGLLYVVAGQIDFSIFVLNLATMLGLGLAIDYALFMTSRFREELERSPTDTAVAVTVATAGRAVFFSGLTVLIGLGGLALFDFMFLRSVGVAGMLVVGISVIGALTLLPAVLSLAGARVNSLELIRSRRLDRGRFWERLSNLVMDHPWRFFVPVTLMLLALGAPFFWVNLSSPDATILPTHVDSRKSLEILRQEFGDGEIAPIVVALETDTSIVSSENLAALHTFTRHFAADERVMRIDSIVTLDPRISLEQYAFMYASPSSLSTRFVGVVYERLASERTTVVFLYPRGLSGDAETKQLLADVRAHSIGGDYTMLVNGGTAEIVDVVEAMYTQFPRIAALVILATYLVLLVQFRSVILPLKAILMNALSIAASYGAVVVIFQWGVLSSLLGFSALGYIEASLPIVMFCVLFGLSMDYEVFLLSRIREEYLRGGDNRTSVALGLQRSGRIITGAALIVVVVTLSFVSAEIVLVKALGVGIAIAILLDATIVRALLVPATMRLLGDLNWWAPGWLIRILPKQEPLR